MNLPIVCPTCCQDLNLHTLADALNQGVNWHEGCKGYAEITIKFGNGEPPKAVITKIG